MLRNVVLCLIFINSLTVTANNKANEQDINITIVFTWAHKLGVELFTFGKYYTRMEQVEENYKNAKIVERDGAKLVEEMAKEIKLMMEMKISAVKRIMDVAENTAISQQDEVVSSDYEYYNAKLLVPPPMGNVSVKAGYRVMNLTRNEHFYNLEVNTSYSAVHVPTNVYDKSQDVIKAIKWSENLDSIFKSNYDSDPSLSWQYFGSSTGFMRQFPAIEWKPPETVDLFDCRTRSWYIEAATSPKDIVILVDNSGSMTGINKEIARHVVNNILDTLGNNDFVNIYTFSDNTQEVVRCFSGKLVQANLANIRQLKQGMEKIDTENIANFSAALTKGFELLSEYRTIREGARCNQAIMLITDGAPYNYKEIFEKYNWKNTPPKPVRVFTYLIGHEVPDIREVKWMACANQGYYVHLSTLAEVREQVLQYVPVMARPMVLGKSDHPTIWTPVYADVTDPKLTDWLWEVEERKEQKESYQQYRRDRNHFLSQHEQDKRFLQKLKRKQNQHGDLQAYKLMTSVSMPVFDRRENAVSSDRETNGTKVANLLGVAGTDVPIQEIQQLMMPYKLGVNGYAFMITNNGYILVHPDLRPVFQGILKPSYNSVDMAEVELVDDDNDTREFDPRLLEFRKAVINQSTGSEELDVKYHYDDMKRVSRIRRKYYYTGITNTSFSLVVTLPEQYGMHRVGFSALEDVHRLTLQGIDIKDYFKGNNWIIHPDWAYCKYRRYDAEKRSQMETPEKELIHFLGRMTKPHWKWLKRTAFPPERCDRELIQSLVNDANITSWFSNNISDTTKEDNRNDLIQRFGLTVVFVSTHSGLTRWQDFPHPLNNDATRTEPHFSEIYKRAIDEIWYKRAVEQHYINPRSFVYSVPVDAGDRNDTLVTASHAIFKVEGDKKEVKAPAAVVGFQFHHRALYALFKNITSTCGEQKPCSKTCDSQDLDCFILDNNGYIMVSENLADTGKFYGEVDGYVMDLLVQEGVYDRVNIIDYQAVCFKDSETKNPAAVITTPFELVEQLTRQLFSYVLWLLAKAVLFAADVYGHGYASEDLEILDLDSSPTVTPTSSSNTTDKDFFDTRVLINRTRPIPCDRTVTLYQMIQYDTKERSPYEVPAQPCTDYQESPKRPFVIQQIPNSNMILLVVDALCKPAEYNIPKMTTSPDNISYDDYDSLACYKANRSETLWRRKPKSCINRHENESKIKLCGRGAPMTSSKLLTISLVFTLVFVGRP